jgi:hypothetical protein
MSWGEYLSNLQRDGLKHAAICGLDGASWIQVTDGSNVSFIIFVILEFFNYFLDVLFCYLLFGWTTYFSPKRPLGRCFFFLCLKFDS